MTWEEIWQAVRRGYSHVTTYLEAFYRHGPAAHGVQGVVREFLDGPPEAVHLSWATDQHGPICQARDARGTYRIELHRQDGRWRARMFLPGLPGISGGVSPPSRGSPGTRVP